MKSVIDLKSITSASGSLIINATDYSALALIDIASDLKDGATLTLKNVRIMSVLDLKKISLAAKGKVIFDLSQ